MFFCLLNDDGMHIVYLWKVSIQNMFYKVLYSMLEMSPKHGTLSAKPDMRFGPMTLGLWPKPKSRVAQLPEPKSRPGSVLPSRLQRKTKPVNQAFPDYSRYYLRKISLNYLHKEIPSSQKQNSYFPKHPSIRVKSTTPKLSIVQTTL